MSDSTPIEVDPVEVAEGDDSATAASGGKRAKLIRPRGKRGGAKNRKGGAAAKDGDAKAKGTDKGKAKEEAVGGKGERVLKSLKYKDVRGQNRPKKLDPKAAAEAASAHSLRIAAYHALEKELARTTDEEKRKELIKKRDEELGGIEAYQRDSAFGGLKGGESGKWCAGQLEKLLGKDKPIRLLDVGALSGASYEAYPFIETTSIDLNPMGSSVVKCDFFEFPLPNYIQARRDGKDVKDVEDDRFDIVALSLVINFVGDLRKRGEMLVHAHSYLKPSGLLYVVLPVACVANSRYLTHDHFREMLDSLGYDVVVQQDSKRLTRWLLRRKPVTKSKKGKKAAEAGWDGVIWKKKEVKVGVKLNNFCIRCGGVEGEPAI